MHPALAVVLAAAVAAAPCGGDDPRVVRPPAPPQPPLPYEVNTHQEIGLQAARRSSNLANFLQDFGLTSTRYSRRHPDAAQAAFNQIRVTNTTAVDLIGAGCVLEDTEWRFFRHFYDPIANRGYSAPFGSWQASHTWGFNGGGEANDNSWVRAFDYFEQAVAGTDAAARRRGQEDLFVTLGYVAHLVQDACQPSHVRNDGHGGYGTGTSALEIFGAANVEPGNVPASVQAAINRMGSMYQNTIRGYFDTAAGFANGEFFSDDTIFKDYTLPSTATTTERRDTVGSGTVDFVVSNNLPDPATPSVMQRLARINRGLLWDSYTLASPQNLVVIDNFESLMPVAVALSQGVIDHFLRGRIQLSVDTQQQPARVMLKNITDAAVVGQASNGVFQSGQIRLFYETEDGTMVELPGNLSPQALPAALAVDDSVALQGDILGFLEQQRAPGLPANQRARSDKRTVVMFRGDIGAEEGICAGRVTFTNNVSLLLSFDTSGSISGSEMAAARNAALTLLPILSQGQGNRISVHRFASSASIALNWTTNIGAAQSVIGGLSPGGSTALYDAIVLAGNQGLAEAQRAMQANEPQKVVVVLFTDGLENASSSSLGAAVGAISRIARPEITEVFLVFVGGSTTGSTALANIAAQSGREFFSLASFGQLTQVFLNIVGASTP